MGIISWVQDKARGFVTAITNIDDSDRTFVDMFEDDIGPCSDNELILDDVDCECD